MSNVGIMMVEVELVIQRISSGCIFCPVATVF